MLTFSSFARMRGVVCVQDVRDKYRFKDMKAPATVMDEDALSKADSFWVFKKGGSGAVSEVTESEGPKTRQQKAIGKQTTLVTLVPVKQPYQY